MPIQFIEIPVSVSQSSSPMVSPRTSPLSNETLEIKNTFISVPNKINVSPLRHTFACLASELSWGTASTTDEVEVIFESESIPSSPCCAHLDKKHACGPAKGNHLHASGQCRPCVFLTRKVGCANGADCGFCHEHHSKKFIKEKKRLNKVKSQSKEHRNTRWENGCFVDTNAPKFQL